MLDAFITERIRQQREGQESARGPLRVEIPLRRPPEEPADRSGDKAREPERGVVVIDDTI